MEQFANHSIFVSPSSATWRRRHTFFVLAGGFLLAWTAFWLHTLIVRAAFPLDGPSSPGLSEKDRMTLAGNGSLAGNPVNRPFSSSLDGRFWVYAAGDGVIPSDANGQRDVFLYDHFSDSQELITSGPGGMPADGDSGSAAITADGRWVAFSSRASNLTEGATDGRWQIYLKDRQKDELRRITSGTNGEAADGDSYYPTLSADGSRLAFVSYANNLVPDDTNGSPDVFLSDLKTGEIRRVSIQSGGGQTTAPSYQPLIDAAGNTIVYVSRNEDGIENVYDYDVEKGETRLISAALDGAPADGSSWVPAVSAEGRQVVFASYAGNLVTGDNNGVMDVFLYDRDSGRISRISTQADGSEFSLMSWGPELSADGRYVSFETLQTANDLPATAERGYATYLYDRETGKVRAVSADWEASAPAFLAELSAAPAYVRR